MLLLAICAAALLVGSATFADKAQLLLAVRLIRLPRLLACLLCGAALAVSGLLCQVLLSNPLASPTLLGVSSGAGFFVALGTVVLPLASPFLPLAAIFGALAASMLIFALSARTGSRRGTLLLAGIAVSSILSAGIDALHTFFPNTLPGYQMFLVGSFAGTAWRNLFPASLLILAALSGAMLTARELDIFALGDETAASLGQNVRFTRALVILLSSVLAGAAVSICGLLGFVGLMTPHLVRKLLPAAQHRLHTAMCILLGAALVALCDLLSRTLFAPFELPTGIALSLLGGPFFLYLLLRRKRHA